MIEYTKKYYGYITLNKNLYDTMLDQYERDFTSDVIDSLFEELKKGLMPIIKNKAHDYPKKINVKYSEEELINCAKYLLNYIGLDMNKIALGVYPHGFTEKMNSNDIRIAFELSNNPIKFVSTIIHEGGHALFEQNIGEILIKYENKTINNLFALHESQSRFYENILGRNINFWIPIYEDIKNMLKLDMTIEEFVLELNKVCFNPIRTEADELTYPLHIILRYEIEKEIFNNNINVDELPKLWNKLTKDYLGIDVLDDRQGLMQDVHWSEGGFGYFPSYLLGTIFDGMFIEIIENNLGSIDEILRNSKIKDITNFLIENIYQYGGAYTSREIFNKLYNKELTVTPILKYYKNKYEN